MYVEHEYNPEMTWEDNYEDLLESFQEYEKESIKWGVEDFMSFEIESAHYIWTITEEQAQAALEQMICKHDSNHGITWDTVEYYYKEYGTKIEKDEEF